MLFWDIDEGSQRSSIEGRHDLGYGRRETDKISGKKIGQSRAFKTICYSADGGFLLAAGDSPFICIYSCSEGLLVRKFQITCNMSLDGMAQFLDRRQVCVLHIHDITFCVVLCQDCHPVIVTSHHLLGITRGLICRPDEKKHRDIVSATLWVCLVITLAFFMDLYG